MLKGSSPAYETVYLSGVSVGSLVMELLECAVLQDDPDNEKCLERKVRTLCQMGKFQRAFMLASQWVQKFPEVSDTSYLTSSFSSLETICKVLDDEKFVVALML